MKVGRKGIAPRYPVLREAFAFDGAMGPLITHLRANNKMDIDAVRAAAKLAATATFLHVKQRLKPVAKEASLEEKLRYNDSISWLRTRYVKTILKISRSNFGYNL